VLAQQYAPDAVVGRDYYEPSEHGAERGLADRVARLRRLVRGNEVGDGDDPPVGS
jgi:putative ATPase